VFSDTAESDIRAYVVWVPKRMGWETDVPYATRTSSDPRSRHFWDGRKKLMAGYERVLRVQRGNAWDIYLLYGPDARWGQGDPPAPDFWMQQIGEPGAPVLDAAIFGAHARALSPHPAAHPVYND